MTDPMAGNGKQKWQRFAWRENRKVAEISDGDRGNGLMETFAFHPSNKYFLMAGRLAQGTWNTAFFDGQSGKLLHFADTKIRVTDAVFTKDGEQLVLGGVLPGKEKRRQSSRSRPHQNLSLRGGLISEERDLLPLPQAG